MAKKKKGGKKKGGKKGGDKKGGGKKGGKKGKKGKKSKRPKTADEDEIIVLPTPASWTSGTEFVEEFRGATPKEQLENSTVFRTYRRKPKSLLVADQLLANIKAIELEEARVREEAGLPPLLGSTPSSPNSSSATSAMGDPEVDDPVGAYRQKALNGFHFGRSTLPKTHSQWKGSVKTMQQQRFPNIYLRRSEFDRGVGKWGSPPPVERGGFTHGEVQPVEVVEQLETKEESKT